jgi:L-iditol 2-dehydrogenase
VTTMRAVRLHDILDARVETLPIPVPGPRDLLVKIEACGICPTDVRKYRIGVNDGTYPFNPGHEWVGRVEAIGSDVDGWRTGQRVYGDTYAGYAEYAVLSTDQQQWSYGPLALDEHVPLDRAVFVEPLADCLHALHDQARLAAGERLVIVGAGQMGLQLTAVGALAEADVHVIEPNAERRQLALDLGATEASGADQWPTAVRDWSDGNGADVVVLAIGNPDLIAPAVEALAHRGRLVLFAGFGDRGEALIDVNRIHYKEMTITGSEWIGVPPAEQRHRYEQAHQLLSDGTLPLESLVTGHCDLDGVTDAFEDVIALRTLKTVLIPGAGR